MTKDIPLCTCNVGKTTKIAAFLIVKDLSYKYSYVSSTVCSVCVGSEC